MTNRVLEGFSYDYQSPNAVLIRTEELKYQITEQTMVICNVCEILEYPEKNLSDQSRERKTYLTDDKGSLEGECLKIKVNGPSPSVSFSLYQSLTTTNNLKDVIRHIVTSKNCVLILLRSPT